MTAVAPRGVSNGEAAAHNEAVVVDSVCCAGDEIVRKIQFHQARIGTPHEGAPRVLTHPTDHLPQVVHTPGFAGSRVFPPPGVVKENGPVTSRSPVTVHMTARSAKTPTTTMLSLIAWATLTADEAAPTIEETPYAISGVSSSSNAPNGRMLPFPRHPALEHTSIARTNPVRPLPIR